MSSVIRCCGTCRFCRQLPTASRRSRESQLVVLARRAAPPGERFPVQVAQCSSSGGRGDLFTAGWSPAQARWARSSSGSSRCRWGDSRLLVWRSLRRSGSPYRWWALMFGTDDLFDVSSSAFAPGGNGVYQRVAGSGKNNCHDDVSWSLSAGRVAARPQWPTPRECAGLVYAAVGALIFLPCHRLFVPNRGPRQAAATGRVRAPWAPEVSEASGAAEAAEREGRLAAVTLSEIFRQPLRGV